MQVVNLKQHIKFFEIKKDLISVFFNGIFPLIYIVVFNFYGTFKLGVDFFGEYFYYISVSTVLNTVVTFGVTTYSSKFLVELIHFKKNYYFFVFIISIIEIIKIFLIIFLIFAISIFWNFNINLFTLCIFLLTHVFFIIPISFFFQLRDAKKLFSKSIPDVIFINLLKIIALYAYINIYPVKEVNIFFLCTTIIPNFLFLIYFAIRYKLFHLLTKMPDLNDYWNEFLELKPVIKNLYLFSLKLSPLMVFESLTSNVGVFLLRNVTGNKGITMYKLFQTILSIILTLNTIWSKFIAPTLIINNIKQDIVSSSKLVNKALLTNLSFVIFISLSILFLYNVRFDRLSSLYLFEKINIFIILSIFIIVSTGLIGTLYTSINKPHFIPIFVGIGSGLFCFLSLIFPFSLKNLFFYHFIGYSVTQLLSFYHSTYILNFRLKKIFYFISVFFIIVGLFFLLSNDL